MSQKMKLLLGIAALVVLLVGAYFLYDRLSADVSHDVLVSQDAEETPTEAETETETQTAGASGTGAFSSSGTAAVQAVSRRQLSSKMDSAEHVWYLIISLLARRYP